MKEWDWRMFREDFSISARRGQISHPLPNESATIGPPPIATTMSRRTGSRAQDHLIPLRGQERARAREMSLPQRYRSRPSGDSAVIMLEGETVNVQVPGDEEPRRIDSTLSLSRHNDPEHSDRISIRMTS